MSDTGSRPVEGSFVLTLEEALAVEDYFAGVYPTGPQKELLKIAGGVIHTYATRALDRFQAALPDRGRFPTLLERADALLAAYEKLAPFGGGKLPEAPRELVRDLRNALAAALRDGASS